MVISQNPEYLQISQHENCQCWHWQWVLLAKKGQWLVLQGGNNGTAHGM